MISLYIKINLRNTLCLLSITQGQALIFTYATNIYWVFVYMSYKKDKNVKKNISPLHSMNSLVY